MKNKTNKGVGDLLALLKEAESKASDPGLRSALAQVGDTETSWSENFAKPMMAKRHQVDAGDATVSDLQIYYLQHDPASWVTKSTTMLDQPITRCTNHWTIRTVRRKRRRRGAPASLPPARCWRCCWDC